MKRLFNRINRWLLASHHKERTLFFTGMLLLIMAAVNALFSINKIVMATAIIAGGFTILYIQKLETKIYNSKKRDLERKE